MKGLRLPLTVTVEVLGGVVTNVTVADANGVELEAGNDNGFQTQIIDYDDIESEREGYSGW